MPSRLPRLPSSQGLTAIPPFSVSDIRSTSGTPADAVPTCARVPRLPLRSRSNDPKSRPVQPIHLPTSRKLTYHSGDNSSASTACDFDLKRPIPLVCLFPAKKIPSSTPSVPRVVADPGAPLIAAGRLRVFAASKAFESSRSGSTIISLIIDRKI